MNRGRLQAIAGKDLRVILRRRSMWLSLIAFPLLLAVGFPLVLHLVNRRHGGIPADTLPPLLDAFLFFFTIPAAALPTAIASYSLVGEKIERSLEPLLATPASDGEILLGKFVAAFVPSVLAVETGAAVYMVLADLVTRPALGAAYYPTGQTLAVLLLVVPLTAAMAVGVNVLVSSRVSEVRTAQQVGALTFLPYAALYVSMEVKAVTLGAPMLRVLTVVLLVVDVVLLRLARRVFGRDEILTRWR